MLIERIYFCNLQGIGGFMVRQRSRPGQGPGKAKRSLCRKDSSGSMSENLIGKDEGLHLNGPNPGSFINVKKKLS